MSETAIETPSAQQFELAEEVKLELQKAVQNLVTEDDEPVDNPFSEKQQRLLVDPLYSSWTPPADPEEPGRARTFWAAANVGVFSSIRQPPVVPDVFVSVDVNPPEDWQKNRAYFFWETGKAPDAVIEIVSNRKGGELSVKRQLYARLGVVFYVVFDPMQELGETILQCFILQGRHYQLLDRPFLPELGLGLTLWHGVFENREETYVRWCDQQGGILPTSHERASYEAERAEHEAERAERLAAKLRELGVDPDQL